MRPELPACPYPGIASFTWNDQDVFFTRDDEARRLIRLIVLYRGVLLYASSGIGKSSLINARVLPMALEEGFLPARLRVQPRRGEEILVEPLPFPSFFSGTAGERVVLSVEEMLERLEALRGVDAAAHPLLIFDQFEEWITLFEGAREVRDRILNAVVKLLNDQQLPVKILISLREDYLARLEPLFERCPSLSDQYVRLTALDGAEVEKAIRGPFDDHPGAWAPEITPQLAQELRSQLKARAGSEGVVPTEIQIVCRRLFEMGQRGVDPAVFFTSQKGVQGILESFLEESLGYLEWELHGPAVALLARMLTSAGTRNVITGDDLIRRVELEDGLKRSLLVRALAQLEDKTRLVRRELRRDVYFYEIVSEFLVDWIRSRAEALRLERVARGRQRFAWISAGLAALFFLMAALAQESELQKQLRISQVLAAQAEEASGRSPWQAVLLALEAVDRARPGGWLSWPDRSIPDTRLATQTEEVLRRVLARCRGQAPDSPDRPVVDALLSRDGRWLAGRSAGGWLYLWETSPQGLRDEPRLLSFSGQLKSLDVSPGARRAAAVWDDKSVAIWDLVAAAPLPEVLDAGEPLVSVVLAGEGRFVLAEGRSTVQFLWEITITADGKLVGKKRRLACSQGPAVRWALSARADRLAAACKDGRLLVWDLLPGQAVGQARPLEDWPRKISALTFDPAGQRLATGNSEGDLCVWDLATPEPVRSCTRLGRETEEVTALAFSPDGHRLVAGGRKGSVVSWNRMSSRAALPTNNSSRAIATIAWSPDGNSLLLLGERGSQGMVYGLRRADRPTRMYFDRSLPATAWDFSPDGQWLVVGFSDGRLYFVDLVSEARPGIQSTVLGHEGEVKTVSFNRDGSWALSQGPGGPRLWNPALFDLATDLGAAPEPQTFRQGASAIGRLVPSPRGLFAMDNEGFLRLWDMDSPGFAPLAAGRVSTEFPWELVLEPDTQRLVTYGRDRRARLQSTFPVATLREEPNIDEIVPSSDGRWVVLARRGEAPALWDLKEPGAPRPLPVEPWLETPLALAPGAKWLLTTNATGDTPFLWNLEKKTGRPIALRSHRARIDKLAFSPDSRWFLTADSAGTVQLWELQKMAGQSPEPIYIHQQEAGGIEATFSLDGQRLATASSTSVYLWTLTKEGSPGVASQKVPGSFDLAFSARSRWLALFDLETRLWDLSAGGALGQPVVLEKRSWAPVEFAFDPQERWLFTKGEEGAIRRWTLQLDEVRDISCRWAGRNLTRDEWRQYLADEPYRRTCPDFPEPPAETR